MLCAASNVMAADAPTKVTFRNDGIALVKADEDDVEPSSEPELAAAL